MKSDFRLEKKKVLRLIDISAKTKEKKYRCFNFIANIANDV